MSLKIESPIQVYELTSSKEEIHNTTDYKSFHYLENGSIEFSMLHTKFTRNKLDKGVYDIHTVHTNAGAKIILQTSHHEESFQQDISFYFEDKIGAIYNSFFNPEVKKKVNALGYNHKLGLLLYGKQGTGKTSMLKKYFTDIVENHNGIVFNIVDFTSFYFTWDFIKDIRKIQDNPIVVFMDEFEELVDPRGRLVDEATFKKASDGFNSIDNCFFMMATNYIERVPETIKDRPSRVKYSIEVGGVEDVNKIEKFLTDSFTKIDMQVDFKEDLKSLVGSTLDELKQYVLDSIMDIKSEINKQSKIGFKN